MNRQNAQYELKIIMTMKSLFSFAVLFRKNTLIPKVMEIVLANKENIAYRFIRQSSMVGVFNFKHMRSYESLQQHV
jgi:hypothetical protein